MPPTASILLPTSADPALINNLIQDNFQTMEVDTDASHDPASMAFHGTIQKRRFIIRCGLEYAERLEDLDLPTLAQSNFAPVDEVRVIPHAATPEDLLLLASVALTIAEKFAGLINLTPNPWSTSDVPPALPGQLIPLREFDEGEPLSETPSHYLCDAAYLKNLMQHPSFTK